MRANVRIVANNKTMYKFLMCSKDISIKYLYIYLIVCQMKFANCFGTSEGNCNFLELSRVNALSILVLVYLKTWV